MFSQPFFLILHFGLGKAASGNNLLDFVIGLGLKRLLPCIFNT